MRFGFIDLIFSVFLPSYVVGGEKRVNPFNKFGFVRTARVRTETAPLGAARKDKA